MLWEEVELLREPKKLNERERKIPPDRFRHMEIAVIHRGCVVSQTPQALRTTSFFQEHERCSSGRLKRELRSDRDRWETGRITKEWKPTTLGVKGETTEMFTQKDTMNRRWHTHTGSTATAVTAFLRGYVVWALRHLCVGQKLHRNND